MVLFWSQMQLLVLVQISLLSKRSLTNLAFKWFFPSMDSNVVDEVPGFIKEPSANLLWVWAFVLADVVSEVSTAGLVVLIARAVLVIVEACFLCLLHFEVLRLFWKISFVALINCFWNLYIFRVVWIHFLSPTWMGLESNWDRGRTWSLVTATRASFVTLSFARFLCCAKSFIVLYLKTALFTDSWSFGYFWTSWSSKAWCDCWICCLYNHNC